MSPSAHGHPSGRWRLRRWLVRSVAVALLAAFACVALVIYFQEYLIFPYYAETAWKSVADRQEPLRQNVERLIVGEPPSSIECWLQHPKGEAKGIAIVFRANLGLLNDHESLIDWAAAHGFTAAVFNYPGMGLSEGSPSEASILAAGEAVYEALLRRYQRADGRTLVIGYSIGTGPAGIFAHRHRADLLVLFAPYTELEAVVARSRWFGMLTPFLRFHFPLRNAVAKLDETDLIVATGGADHTVLPELSEEVFRAHQGRGRKLRVHNPRAPHDRLLGENRADLDAAMKALGYQ